MKTKRKPKDLRTFCRRCMMEMHNAGIKLKRHGGPGKCDKCHRPGDGWEVID